MGMKIRYFKPFSYKENNTLVGNNENTGHNIEECVSIIEDITVYEDDAGDELVLTFVNEEQSHTILDEEWVEVINN